MGFYNVIKPCYVARKHYVRPTVQPIELDDDVEAAALLDEGCIEPYAPGVHAAPTLGVDFVPPYAVEVDDEPPTIPAPPRARAKKRSEN